MNVLLDWFATARWRMALSHCVEGLLIQIPIGLLFNFRIGAFAVIVWYWSRKKTEVELDALGPQEPLEFRSHAYSWSIGWFPWQWDAYKVLDVALPAVSALVLARHLTFYRGPFML